MSSERRHLVSTVFLGIFAWLLCGISLGQDEEKKIWMEIQNRFHALKDAGNLSDALKLAPELEQAMLQTFGNQSEQLAGILTTTGDVFRVNKQFNSADQRLTRAVVILQRSRRRPGLLAGALGNLALLRIDQRRWKEAEQSLREALKIHDVLNSDGPEAQRTLEELVQVLKAQNRVDEASLYQQRIDSLRSKVMNVLPNQAHAEADLMKQAAAAYASARYDDAENLYLTELRQKEALYGSGHPDVAIVLRLLGDVYQMQKRTAEAEADYKRSIGIYEQQDYPSQLGLLLTSSNLSALYLSQCRLAEAELVLAKSATIIESAELKAEWYGVVTAVLSQLTSLGGLYYAGRNVAEQQPFIKRVLAIITELKIAQKHDTPVTLTQLPLSDTCAGQQPALRAFLLPHSFLAGENVQGR